MREREGKWRCDFQMGHLPTKSSTNAIDYASLFSSTNSIYRGPSLIQSELQITPRSKIRVDLIGQLLEQKNCSTRASKCSLPSASSKKIFFTCSPPLVTSYQNGTARKLKKQAIAYPFRIPMGSNLPSTCQFNDFALSYHLEISHDGHLIPRSRKTIIFTPPSPHANTPLSSQVNGKEIRLGNQLISQCFQARMTFW